MNEGSSEKVGDDRRLDKKEGRVRRLSRDDRRRFVTYCVACQFILYVGRSKINGGNM